MDFERTPKNKLQRHFPNILEYWIDENDKVTKLFGDDDEDYDDNGLMNELATLTATTITKEEKILSLLTTFTNNIFFTYKGIDGSWGMPTDNTIPREDLNSASSKWSMGIFFYPGMPDDLKISGFTEITINPIQTVDYPDYYLDQPHLDSDWYTDIQFPSILDYLLDSYFNLEGNAANSVNAAISYTASAVELFNTRKTLSLLSSFTSLETMVNLEYDGVDPCRCRECGQQRFSISKKFRDYLLKYIGDTQSNKKKFNKYYALRSKIVHTGKQLQSELLFADVEQTIRHEELITRTEILQLGKLSIINWLLEN
ncbi:hypothetical protein GCM10011375_16430 [Hymenobacter qilianensis]|nr:hypothetical protein GCM10011375_16430 [Hymenobacter qilianensis]